jgi:phage terminase large subunit GpA-like protein
MSAAAWVPIVEAAGVQLARQAFANGLRPDPRLTVSEWADENRVLTVTSSPEPGPWRTSRTPYLKEPMDCLSPSSRTEMVVLMSGAQIGKTECGNNWIGYVIHKAPGPFLAVQPSTEMAKRNSKQRIAPLIADCPALRERVREARSRDSGNTMLSKEFPGGILVMTGANSAKGLRSMPTRYLFLDEVDGYPGDVEGEGEPCDLAIARTKNFARRKIFIASTPVVSGRSRIERYYESSDKCEFFVPCPICEHMQTLRLENLRWERNNPASAHFLCEACGRGFSNHAKTWMLARGEWRPQAPNDGRIRGFYLPSFYSPVGWLSWAQIAEMREKAEAEKSREKLQVFWNTVLGLPWADVGEVPDADRLYERRETYQMGKVPAGGLVLTAGADVQLKRIEVEIVAWGRNKESWSVDYRVLEGDTQQPAVWSQLADLVDEEFPSVYGGALQIQKLAVDTGFNTLEVYEFVRAMGPARVMGIKGDLHRSAFLNVPTLVDVGPQGRKLKKGVRLWSINVAIGKEQLYRWLKASVPDLEKGEAWPAGFCHFPQYGKEYFEQLCAEQLITRTLPNGMRHTSWEKIRERNEALDARIYAMAAAASLRLDMYSPEKWDSIERSLTLAAPGEVVKRQKTPPPEFRSMGANESFLE